MDSKESDSLMGRWWLKKKNVRIVVDWIGLDRCRASIRNAMTQSVQSSVSQLVSQSVIKCDHKK